MGIIYQNINKYQQDILTGSSFGGIGLFRWLNLKNF